MDRLTCDKERYGRRATQPGTVLRTRSSVLLGKDNLPDDWTREAGVLVGIVPLPPPPDPGG